MKNYWTKLWNCLKTYYSCCRFWKFGENNQRKWKEPKDRRTDWLRCVSCVQAQIWPSSACCAGSVSRPRRLCSSTWRCTPASAATSAASATGPSPATLHSSATYAHTQVSDPSGLASLNQTIGAPSIVASLWAHESFSLSARFLLNAKASSPSNTPRSLFPREKSLPFKPDVLQESVWCTVGKCIVLCYALIHTFSVYSQSPPPGRETPADWRSWTRPVEVPQLSSAATSCHRSATSSGPNTLNKTVGWLPVPLMSLMRQFLLCGSDRILQETCISLLAPAPFLF